MQSQNQLEINLSIVLAHSALYEMEREYPSEYCAEFRNGGDPPAPTTTESMDSILTAMSKDLPGLSQVVAANIPTIAQAQANAAKQVSPQNAALQTQLFQQYAPQLNKVGQDINASNAQAQAASDAAVLKGPGAELVRNSDALSREIDPEFYKTRTATSNALNNILGFAGDLSGKLTGGETEAINRALGGQNATSGLLNVPTATNTVSNAMTFGNAARNRQLQNAGLGVQAAGVGGQFMGASKTVDPLQAAVGRSSTPNQGAGQFMGADTKAGNAGLDFGQNVLGTAGNLTQQANQINAQRRDSLDRINETFSSMPSVSD